MQVRQLVSTEAFGPNFLQLLGRDDAPGLVTEAAWLTSYITAAPGNLLPLEDVLPPLLTVLQKGLSQVGFSLNVTSQICQSDPTDFLCFAGSSKESLCLLRTVPCRCEPSSSAFSFPANV